MASRYAARISALAVVLFVQGFLFGCGGQAQSGTSSGLPALPAATRVPGGVPLPIGTPGAVGTPTRTITPSPVPVNLSFKLPATLASASVKRARSIPATSNRSLQYVASTTTQIRITVTPFGGSGTVYGPSPCTSGICTISFTALPGPNSIAFALTNAGNSVLSTFTSTVVVQPAGLNTLRFSANPVVNSASVSLGSPSVLGGVVTDVPIAVNALDVDGNTIAGTDAYVDAGGSPLTLSLAVANVQSGGRGSVRLLGSTRIASPAQASIVAHYDGQALTSAAVSVAASRQLAGTLGSATLTVTPNIVAEYTIPTGNSQPTIITKGPDGALWFTESNASKIGRISTSGIITEFTIPTASSTPIGITTGPDGNMWFTEVSANKIGRLTPGGVMSEYAIPTSAANAFRIITGPDGNLWTTEYAVHQIARVTPQGSITEFQTPTTPSQPRNLVAGSDGTMWFTEGRGQRIGRLSVLGTMTEFSTLSAGGYPDAIALGPDGNIWFSELFGNKIARISPSGAYSEFTIPTGSSSPTAMTAGPDGNLYFGESAKPNLGQITTAGSITEYPTPASAGVYGVCSGPDGNIWFTELGGNKIGKFVY